MEREKMPNQEHIKSEILLKFFRHGVKGEVGQDGDIRLSEEGRKEAAALAGDLENPSLAKAWGSDRIRTEETASLMMDGDLEKTVDDAMKERGIMGMKRVEKEPIDAERLNFHLDMESKTGQALQQAYDEKRYFRHVVENSDRDAIENGETEGNTTFSVTAANISSIVKQYLEEASDRWEKIYRAEEEGDGQREFPKGYKPTLERFMGSHQGVTESFLVKVIDKLEGPERKEEFISAIEADGGFKETEGYDVRIVNDGEEKKVRVKYEKRDEEGDEVFSFEAEIPPEILDEIIAEGELKPA